MSIKNNSLKKIKEDNKNISDENIIIGKIKIKKNNGLKARIINSYENAKREDSDERLKDKKFIENEEEIKNCEIFINEKKIEFDYNYNFPDEGEYIIKYKFNKLLSSTTFMFSNCYSLISLDLSNFNTENVTEMCYMFSSCFSLISLNLSNFNTQNVKNMDSMFSSCNSLQLIDLSNFNTKNVINMNNIFGQCYSLQSIDLSKFDTQNVIKME